MGTRSNRSFIPVLVGILAGGFLVLAGVGVRLDLSLLDAMQRSAAPDSPSPVVIIDIDSDTTIDFGWPISPAIYALVIQAVHDAGAKAIGVDVLFHDQRLRWMASDGAEGMDVADATAEEADPEDELLGRVVAETGAVLATYSQRDMAESERVGAYPDTPGGSRGSCGVPNPRSMAAPLRPGLRSVRVGHVNLVTVPDGVHRKLVDCAPVHDGCLRSLSSVMFDPEGTTDSCGEAEIVPYRRPFDAFPRISMADVILLMGTDEGMEELRSVLEGRYALLGPSDTGVGDLGPTPASPLEPLVAVHANRVEAQLEGRRIFEAASLFPSIAGVALLLVLMWFSIPARGWLAIAAGGLVVGIVMSFGAFRLLSAWIPATPFILPVALGALSAAGWGGWQHFRFNQMLTQAFGNYVSPDVLEWLQETDGAALDPTAAERREITVLFSDIAGYTRLSNDLDAEGVMSSLRLYLHAMVAVIQRHGGYLDKINGDGLMVLFGAPKVAEKSAEAAVACAKEMLDEVARLQAAWRAITGGDLRIRVGLATGRAFVGNLGGEGHVEYTAIGPVVNLAARLESKAPIGGILFCEATHGALLTPPPGEWTEVDLKGYEAAGPVRVYSVPPFPKD